MKIEFESKFNIDDIVYEYDKNTHTLHRYKILDITYSTLYKIICYKVNKPNHSSDGFLFLPNSTIEIAESNLFDNVDDLIPIMQEHLKNYELNFLSKYEFFKKCKT